MGALRQLGALFWKNFLIRKRHPTFLVLELLWPILLFAALAFMRLGSPPDHRETCEYHERALPSAGLVPFLQSSICTLNNNCSQREWIQERTASQEKFQAMIRDIDPLLYKDTTIDAFRALPTVSVVLNAIKDVTNGSTIDEMDEKLVIRNMFKDPDQVVYILSDKYDILEKRVAEALLDASLNAVALVGGIGSVDFKGIVCDPDELEDYLILSDKSNKYVVNKYSVSTALCRIEDDTISDITNELMRQLDVANVIRLIRDVANISGSIDYAVLIEDIADLVDMYLNESSLLSMVDDMIDFSAIPGVIREFGNMIPILNNLNDIDFESIGSLLNFITPLMENFIEDSEALNEVDVLLTSASDTLSLLSGNMSLEQILDELPKLMNMTELWNQLNIPPMLTNSIPYEELNKLLGMFQGNTNIEDMSLNDTLDFAESTMTEVFGNETADMIMAMATNMVEMMDHIRVHYNNMGTDLKYAVTNTDAVTVALNKLDEAGPEMTYIFMNKMVTMENIYTLMTGETSTKALCQDAAIETYEPRPDIDYNTVVTVVCSDEATQAFDQVFVANSMSKLTSQLEKEMTDMDSIMQGTIPADQEIRNMRDIYYDMMDMMAALPDMTDEDPEEWLTVLEKTNMDYYGEYNWVWNKIGSQYKVQTMIVMPVLIIGQSAVNSPIWESWFSPNFEMTDAMLHNVALRIKWFEEMNEENQIITQVFKYLPYYPMIVESAVGQNISELTRVISGSDTSEITKLLCEETQWDKLDVPDDISIDDMRMFICQTNITKFVEDVWRIADPLSFLADVEFDVEANLENGIQWTRMARDLQYLYETLDNKNSVQGLLTTVFQTDLSMMASYYTVIEQSLSKMTMEQITSDMENGSDIASSLEDLDEALSSWGLWKRVKHYIRTWTLMAKVLNEYAELVQDPDWDITEYLTKVSPTLGHYLQNSTETMPEVIDALQTAANEPQQMITRLMNVDYMGFCDDPKSLSSLLGVQSTQSFTDFQDGLCKLDWSQIEQEMKESGTPWSDFISQWEMIMTYDTASLPPLSLDWTDVISATQKLLDNINEGMFNSFTQGLSNFGLTGTESSISNLTSALQNTWDFDPNEIGRAIDELTKLLFDMSPGNDTFIEMWQYSTATQSYISYHFLKFANIHLDIINRTKTFELRAHLNSPEANKLFDLLEQSPEVNAVLLHNMKLLFTGSNTALLNLDLMNFCNDTAKLEAAIEIPVDNTISKSEVVDAVCSTIDGTLVSEVVSGMEGLEEFIEAIENVTSGKMTASEMLVSYTKTAAETERFTELIAALTTGGIVGKGFPVSIFEDIDILLEQFTEFSTDLLGEYETMDPMQVLQSSGNQTLESLRELQEIPGFKEIIRISEMYMRVLTAILTKSQEMLLDPATGFQGYPEMYKMWKMMEWLPQLYATFTYTSLVDSSKITTFTEALIMGTEALCEKDPSDLMTDPPILNIEFEYFFDLFCSVNFTHLEEEVMLFIEQEQIADTYDGLESGTGEVDLEGWMAEYDRLSEKFEEFTNNAGQFNTPGFDNMTVWEVVMSFLEDTTNNLDTLAMATGNMGDLLEVLVSMSGDFQGQLKAMEITYYVMEKMLDHLENMTDDPHKLEDFFYGYSQMQHLIVLLQEPGVMETLMTTVNTPKFQELLENTNATAVLEDICDSDITKYMTVPDTVTANMNDAKDRFCDTDFDILMEEFVDAFFIEDIINMMSENTTIDWKTITEQNSHVTERLTNWIENPPNVTLPPNWENSTYWFELLNLLNADHAVTDDEDPMSALLQGIENYLGNQYSDLINSMTPLALQLIEMINLDSDAKRAFATIDLFMDYMVDRLMEVSDNFTVDTLSMNSTDIIRLLEALSDLKDSAASGYDSLNKSVDQEKLYNLLLDPDRLMEMCENDNVAAYLSLNGTANKASIALEEVICIDTTTWEQVLENQIQMEMFEEKLAEIWNSSNSNVYLNWTSLSQNTEKFVEMFLNWLEDSPEASNSLMQWNDWDGIMSFLSSAYNDPNMLMNLLDNVNPLFGSEMRNLTDAFTKLLIPFFDQLQSGDIDDILNNPEKIGSLIESMISIDDWLNLLSQFVGTYYGTDEKPTRHDVLDALVCDENGELSKYIDMYLAGMLTVDPWFIRQLCLLNQTEWDTRLQTYYGFTDEDLRIVHDMFDRVVEDKMSAYDERTMIDDLMDMFEKLKLDGLLNSSTTDDWLQNSQDIGIEELLSVLEMMGDESLLTDFKKTLLVIIEAQEYINMMLNRLTGNESMPLVDFLPSSSAVASFLESLTNSETVSTFAIAYINPAKFITLMFSQDWNSTVCNMTLFLETFEFPADVNVTSLQHQLCTDYAFQKPYLDDIMKAVDLEKLIQNIEDILMNDTVTANQATWEYMSNLVESITRQFLDVGNVNATGFEGWLDPILQALENMAGDNQELNYEETCERTLEYVRSSEYWMMSYLDTVHTFIMISNSVQNVLLGVDKAVCQSEAENITQVIKHLEELGVTHELTRIEEIISQRTEKEFSCSSYSTYYNFFETFATSLTTVFDGSSNIVECLGDVLSQSGALLEDVSKLFSAGSEASELLLNEDVQKLLNTLMGSNDSAALIDTILMLYNQQEEAVKQLQEGLENDMTDITSFLQETLSTGLDSVFDSLNITHLNNVDNMTAEELIEKLCSSGNLETLDESLQTNLCGDDSALAESVAENLIDYARTLQELEDMLEYDSTTFWEKVSGDVSALVGNIEGLTSLTGLVDSFGQVDISALSEDRELLRTIQELLVDNGPDTILENLNTLLDDFKILDDSEITNAVVDDMKVLAEGIFAFTSLRDLFMADVKVNDLVKDTAQLKEFLINDIGLPVDVTDAIVDGSLSIGLLLEAAEEDITGWICDSVKLQDLIDVKPGSDLDIELVSRQFCSLDSDTVTAVVDELFQQLDVGDLMEDMVVNGINEILRTSNVTLEDTRDAVIKLVNANDDLQEITKTFNDFADTIPDAFTNLAQAQTGNQEFGSLSTILCGNALPIIRDEFNTGAALEGQDDLTDEQKEELDALPGKACKDMYMRILEDTNGPIIWTYLKPLMRGKLLYAPDTPEVRTVISQINTTFSSLEEFIDIAVDWAEGSVALGNLTGKKAKELQDLLNSNVIKTMMTEVAGVDMNDLDDILYTLEDTNMDMMEGISKVAKMLRDYISCLLLDRFEGFDTEKELEKAAHSLAADNNLLAGIVFDMSDGSSRKKRQVNSEIPTHIHYTIRMDMDSVADTKSIKDRMWRPQPYDNFFTELRYFRGFAQLQDMIDTAIISLHVGDNVTLPSTTTHQFPFPCHTQDAFVNVIAGYLLNVLMTLSWLAAISVAVYNYVYDREQGQEETLVAMGMKSGLNWFAWFFSTMFVMAIVAFVDVIILRYGNVFTHSNMAITYLFFLDFIFSTIMMCYFISAFFTRTSLAILACIIVYVISYLPFVVLFTLEVQMEFWHKTLACLASTSAFSYAAQYIARFEEQQIGLKWDNIRDDPMYDDGFSFSWCCIMILIDGVIYFILGWYVRNVKPGKFGVAEPWYFIFVPSMWCANSSGKDSRYSPKNNGIFAEEVSSATPVVLSARGLSKTYSDGTNAVKDLNLDIHCGNVTTLLGHNGAAKTTTMNMLIGVLQPSQGGIRILNRPLKAMKGCIGVCSQHNALYDYMTVKEHMEFYSSMKGGSMHGLSPKDEIRQLLKDVDLYDCRSMLVKNLSGGMKRRLCVALAFVGGSKAVILDEPTSGVDPSGRRAVWNLIIRRKSDKTNGGTAVLLSTHHLDEADIISDQIAIMHQGNLLCQGSPMFLKKHLASGHRLTVVKENADSDPVEILTLLKRWLPGAKLQETAGAEMTFLLPTANEADFYALFKELESQKHVLGIVNYGISDPKLEEVFMKVCTAADIGRKISPEALTHIDEEETEAKGDTRAEWKHDFESTESNGSRTKLSKSSNGSGGGLTALLTKRFHHYRRDWRIVLTTLVLPLLLVFLASGLYKVKPDASSSPNLYLSPAMYGPSKHVFMQQNSPTFDLGDHIFNTFMNNPGIGTSCMEGMRLGDPYRCVKPDTEFSLPAHSLSSDGRCYCDDNEYKCEGSPYGAPPEQRVTPTSEILQNLHGRDINKYLLNSFPEFILKRFGGWSFDDESDDAETKLKAKIWYDNHGYHALPSFYNAYSNGLLRALMNDSTDAPKYGISTYNHPMMLGREQLNKFSILQHAADIGIAVIFLLAFTFIPVGVLLYSVYEYVNKEKHMQFISGITPFTYWIASLIWDLLVLGVAVGVSVIALLIFKPGSFWDRRNLEATVCLLLLYGWATITLAYLLVKRFKNSGTAFFTLFCSLMFIGIFCVLIIFAFNYFQSDDDDGAVEDAYKALRYAFLVFPPYALAGGLLDLTDNQIKTVIYERFGTDVYKDPFTFDMLGWHMFAMGVEGLLFFILTVWIDVNCCCKRRYVSSYRDGKEEDDDVAAERKRIDAGNIKDDMVIVRNLRKIYNGGKKEVNAVNGLSFGVPSGQCFGLLGVNGAGKSSTFNVLTGVTNATYGHAYILGNRIEPGSSTVGRNMGYCPQDDALDPYLSIENTLYFHAKLKGLDSDIRKHAVEKVMAMLDLHKIKDKIVKSCSGGMKRKLSLAVALLGDPAIILLDEPTTGMDPKAKRLVWNCLLEAKRNGQAIILTSHSLEECDILCDRMGIMVNGVFKCLGTSQHLKQKYGDGYTVTLYVAGLSDSMSRIYELINNFFPGAGVTDQHVNVVQLDIPGGAMRIADTFGILEREKANYNILYYTVSQTTLDTIFLNFAREQTDGSAVEISDTHSASSDRDSYNSQAKDSAFANPYYGRSSTFNGDKGKPSSAYDSPYNLPASNTFNDESFSTKL